MKSRIVHVVGTGTIGEPVAHILLKNMHALGIDEVTFHKNSPTPLDRGKVSRLLAAGGKLSCDESKFDSFKSLGFPPSYSEEEAIERAAVIIDATPEGTGLKNKASLYSRYDDGSRLFLAQGSEFGFGQMYAFGINDETLKGLNSSFVHIVSCNTHSIASIIKTLACSPDSDSTSTLSNATFVCMRRASDVGEKKSISSPEVGEHKDHKFGTHHAKDAYFLFKTKGLDLNIFSSAVKLNTQLMHTIWFHLILNESITLDHARQRVVENSLLAVTQKLTTSEIFQVGREHGFMGRIFNHSVIPLQTISISPDGRELFGFAFTPQDGNSLLSSVAATSWFLHGNKYLEVMRVFGNYYFSEI